MANIKRMIELGMATEWRRKLQRQIDSSLPVEDDSITNAKIALTRLLPRRSWLMAPR
jgi:hypothetical protein